MAPTVALSLTGLVAVAGLGFDYTRMAAMDSELQNAADQAALAAASQLDGKAGACTRAALAASSLVENDTLFSNDGTGVAIDITNEATCDDAGTIKFYQDKAKTIAADADANANFVQVQVETRRANYAFTALIAAVFNDLTAYAYAGMDSAVCKVPPLMMCNPDPGTPFDPDDYKGVGLKLVMGGNNAWAPGAFGYLDVGQDNNGTPDQRAAMAYNNPALSCASISEGEVDTGLSSSVFDAVNVRFDIFQNGWANNNCAGSASCSPANNTTKDLVRKTSGANSCSITNNPNSNGWWLPADADQYVAENAAGDDANVVHMGYPMDICHYPAGGGGCTRLGNGSWRRDIYFQTNHPAIAANWQTATGLTANATRFQVYDWEQSASGSLPDVSRNSARQHGAPVCNTTTPSPASPIDRRVVAVAIAENCGELNGASNSVEIGEWAAVFLTMPAGIARPAAGITNSELYIEIIGRTSSGAYKQILRRDVPYLIE